MQAYMSPIHTAALVFLSIALLATIPYMLYNYRRYGAVSPLRTLVLFSFMLYLLCAYALVILPLPDPAEVAARQGAVAEFIPFTFVRRFLQDSPFSLHDPSTYLPALKSSAFLEPFFNLLLLLPLGVYLAYYFKQNLRKTLLAGFLASLFFELTQLTGLYGLYARPYRLFSVDDLLLNTLGSAIGYSIGVKVLSILPSKQRMDQASRARSAHVSYMRRATATVLDLSLVLLLVALAVAVVGPGPLLFPASFLLYYAGLGSLTRGRTLGKMLVRIRVRRAKEQGPLALWLLLRYGLVLASIVLFESCFRLVSATDSIALSRVGLLASLLIPLAYIVSWVVGFFRQKRLWYELLSRTFLESTFANS